MLRNYLIVAWRNLLRHKLYSAINVVGLAVGIAFCLLALLFVQREWSYDAFHDKRDRIFRLYTLDPSGAGGRVDDMDPRLAPTLTQAFPPIIRAVSVQRPLFSEAGRGSRFSQEEVLRVSPGFLMMFTFPLCQGDASTALSDPGSVVITVAAARRHFGDGEAMGQMLTIRPPWFGGKPKDYTVAAVIEDVPSNSSLRFSILIPALEAPLQTTEKLEGREPDLFVYLELAAGTHPDILAPQLSAFLNARRDPDLQVSLGLQPLRRVHLDTSILGGLQPPSDPRYSYVLATIAIAVLLVACINFVNLSVGLSAGRVREVGVRKATGATRAQVMRQSWGESMLFTAAATVLGIGLVEATLPIFNALTRQSLTLDLAGDGAPWLAILVLLGVVGMAAGGYPALVLSTAQPVDVLGRERRFGGHGYFGQWLIVLQFAVSALLIGCTLTMVGQLDYVRKRTLGVSGEQVLRFSQTPSLYSRTEWEQARAVVPVFMERIRQYSAVVSITHTTTHPLFPDGADARLPNGEHAWLAYVDVDAGFLSTLGLELVEGRGFDVTREADVGRCAVINQTMVARLGLASPIGARLPFGVRITGADSVDEPEVIGVVRDFHITSLHQPIEPLALILGPQRSAGLGPILIRLQPTGIAAARNHIERTWRELAPNVPFTCTFLDEHMNRLYESENRWADILRYAALFAVFVACMGALGMTAIAIATRTREIGIRKALGASVGDVVWLFSRKFALLGGAAALVAGPLTIVVMGRWLQSFAYRIEVGPAILVVAVGLTELAVLSVVALQALAAALANPTDALRQE